MWKRYASRQGDVAVQSTVARLRDSDRVTLNVFIVEVEYIDRRQYQSVRAGGKVTPMLLPYKYKRRQFAFEQEVRAIIWDPAIKYKTLKPVIYLDYDLKRLVESVVLAPGSQLWNVEATKSLLGHYGLKPIVR